MSRFWRRCVRRTAVAVSAALLVSVGTQSAPPQLLSAPAHINWSAMLSWAESTAEAVFPSGSSGTAGGLSHAATSRSTRAGHGVGSAPGKGAGALSAHEPKAASVAKGLSGRAIVGFNARTSKFDSRRSSADIAVFDNADGTITKHVSQSPVDFKNPQGQWQQIDTNLVRTGSGALQDKANAFTVSFGGGSDTHSQSAKLQPQADASSTSAPTDSPSAPDSATPSPTDSPAASDSASSTPSVSASVGGSSAGDLASVDLSSSESFAWSLQGAAQVAPAVSGDAATYADILPDTTLELSDQAWGVRELFVLSSTQAANSWTFPLSMTGVTLSQASDGTWELVDGSGSEVAYLDQPWAMDSNFDPVTGESVRTQDVSYSLATVDGVEQLTMTLDQSWLDDAARVFPVTVDPTVTITDGESVGTETSTYADEYCTVNCIANSSDYQLKVGNISGTGDLARSFVDFPAADLVDKGEHVVSAQLAAFMFWTGTSTDLASNSAGSSSLEVGPLDSAIPTSSLTWNQSNCTGNTDCAGTNIPLMNTSSGDAAWTSGDGWSSAASCSDIPSTQSTNVNRWVYDDISDVSWFNAWQVGTSPYYGFFMAGVNDFKQNLTSGNSWKLFGSARDTACAPYLSITEDTEQAPQVTSMSPPANASLATLTPVLRATGSTADSWNPALTYDFTVFSGSTGKQLATSNSTSATSYTVKPGVLSWGQTYTWRVQVYDGDPFGGLSSVTYNPFSTVAPPPLLTDGLSQNTSGHGVDPSIGNYTTSATDASVGGMGPALEIDRDYNSLDPRTSQALGAGWSSILDARATQVYDGDGNLLEVVFTYPDGSQVPFGVNADASYAPPEGTFGTVTYSSSSGYTLIDKTDTTYTFGQNITPSGQTAQVWGLTTITNAQGQALALAYNSGRVSELTGASKRHLFVTWQSSLGSGATFLHVSTITTDPVTVGGSDSLAWTYNYNGDQLAAACDPDQKCTDYGYQAGSEYQNAILDAAPSSYWPLNDPSGSTPAASAVLSNEQADQGTYANVTMAYTNGQIAPMEISGNPPSGPGGPAAIGPLAASPENVANFNGTNASLYLSKTSVVGQSYLTISLWFKTSSAGPLWCNQDTTLSTAAGHAVCSLYVGTDGKLHGGFYAGSNSGMISTSTVDDSAWHQAVLEAGGTGQALYIDGVKQGTESGIASNGSMSDTYVGAGFNSTDWPNTPSTRANWYFSGELSNVAYWTQSLSGVEIANMYQIGSHSTEMLTSTTNPVQVALGTAGVPAVQVAYDAATGRVMNVWDGQGEYQLSVPNVTGSSQVFRSAVLGSGPSWYWRLADSAGAPQATDEVNAGAGTYNNVMLGGAGEFPDTTTGAFDGSSSNVALPSGILDSQASVSVGLWFKASAAGGVLFSHSQTALSAGSTTVDYQPWLYVGKDGKLIGSIGAAHAIESSATVVDGKWHYALLTGSSSSDQLYLDGSMVGTGTPLTDAVNEGNVYVGAGYIGGTWPDEANSGSSTATPEYFNGSISDVAVWRETVDSQTASALYHAAQNSTGLTPAETVDITNPGATAVSIPFDGTSYQASAGKSWTGSNTFLTFGTDGNLVVKQVSSGSAHLAGTLWSSGTAGNPNATLTFGTNGNMVIANGSTVLWSSGTTGDPSVTGILTAAGDFQLDSGVNRQVWHTATNVTGAMNVAAYEFDPLNGNRMIAQADADGHTTTYGYDTQGFLNTVTDPNGNVTTTQHDVRGNTVAKTTCQDTAADKCSTQYWTYYPDDTSAQLTTPSPENDLPITYRNGNSSSSTDATYETTYGYDKLGDKTSETTPPVASESYTASNGAYNAGTAAGLTTTDEYTGEKLSNGTTVTQLDYSTSTVDIPNGLMVSSTTPAGNETTYQYDANGDLRQTVSPTGLETQYEYNGIGQVVEKTVSFVPARFNQDITYYTYDGEGRTATETDQQTTDAVTGLTHQGYVQKTYDADGNLKKQVVSDLGTAEDAARTTQWMYTAFDQLQSETDPVGNTTQYTYYPNGLKETSQDPEHNVTQYQYDPDGNLTATILQNYNGSASDDSTPGALTEESRSYDPADRLAAVTDAEGVTTAYTYYDNGLRASASVDPVVTCHNLGCQPPPPVITESDTYDDAGNLTSKTTNNGTDTTGYTYDADNRVLTTTVDPGGSAQQVTTDTYFPDSTVATSSATAQGVARETENTYDSGDSLLTSTLTGDGVNRQVVYTRDPRGLATSVQDPDGNITNYIYDALGQLTITEQPGTATTTFNASTLTATNLPPTSGSAAPIPETTVGYDTFGETAEVKDPDGNTTQNFYYADGKLHETELDGGYTPVTGSGSGTNLAVNDIRTYTADGQLYQETDPDGYTTTYGYDQFGHEISVQDPVNGSAKPAEAFYDKAGQPSGDETPAGTQTSTAYDAYGRVGSTSVYEAVTGQTNTTQYTYNTANLLQQTTSPMGVATSYTYDDVGETATQTDGAQNTVSFTYDGFGDLAKTELPTGSYTQDAYNSLGLETSSTTYTPTGICQDGGNCIYDVAASSTVGYDNDGNKKSQTQAMSSTQSESESFDYYPTGWLKDEVQQVDSNPADAISVRYGYDLDGNQTAYTNGNTQTTYWAYDGLGTPDTKTIPATSTYSGPAEQTTSYAYDQDGNITAETQPDAVTQNFTYDANGDLKTADGSAPGVTTPARAFDYTPDGQVKQADTCTDTSCGTVLSNESFTYTSEGQLWQATGAAGTSTFAYNKDNQATSALTSASTTATTYGYDTAGRLQTVSDPLTSETDTYAYNSLDEVSSIAYGSGGTEQEFAYNKLGELTGDSLYQGSNSVGQIGYGYDEAGDITSKTDQNQVANTYAYDDAGRLTSWDTPSNDTNYTYDNDSNRKSISITSVAPAAVTNTITNQYDPRDELTQSTSTPAAGSATTTNYTYTANGTLATAGSNTATFDAFGEETSYGNDSYTYDALGRALTQTRSTVGTGATSTTTDLAYVGPTNQLANDGNGNTYAYSPTGTAIAASTNGSSVDLWTDQHTDVVGDFSPTGTNLLGTTEYDPLGDIESQSGNAASLSIGYQSGYADSATGQVNMAARWYSPTTGQFTSADTASNPAVPNPANANPFGYADASPLDGTDPTGHNSKGLECDCDGGGAGGGFQGVGGGGGASGGDTGGDGTDGGDGSGGDTLQITDELIQAINEIVPDVEAYIEQELKVVAIPDSAEDPEDAFETFVDDYVSEEPVSEQSTLNNMSSQQLLRWITQEGIVADFITVYLDTLGDGGPNEPACHGTFCSPRNPTDPRTKTKIPGDGPTGGGGGGGAPTCDAACQFQIHLDFLNNLSGQGRGKQQAGSSTVSAVNVGPSTGPTGLQAPTTALAPGVSPTPQQTAALAKGMSSAQYGNLVSKCAQTYSQSIAWCENLPVFVVNGQLTPMIAENDMSAIDYGQPFLLHYRGPQPDSVMDQIRKAAGCGSAWRDKQWSCDEYPFASSLEGGAGADTFGVPLGENRRQGGQMSRFIASNSLTVGSAYLVYVINVSIVNGAYVAN